jgi:hypothetical protein
MELTEKHIEKIKEAAKEIDYGSVTIKIRATSDVLDIDVTKCLRMEKELSELIENKN